MTKEELDQTIGQRIAAARSLRGIERRELAAKVGFTTWRVARIESAHAGASIFELVQIAKALGTTIPALIGDQPLEDNAGRVQ